MGRVGRAQVDPGGTRSGGVLGGGQFVGPFSGGGCGGFVCGAGPGPRGLRTLCRGDAVVAVVVLRAASVRGRAFVAVANRGQLGGGRDTLGGGPLSGTVGGSALRGSQISGAPVKGAPVGSGPVSGGPVSGGPVSGAPVDGGPVDGGPVDGGPVDGGPVDGGPVSGAPVDGAPIGVRAVSAGPVSGPVLVAGAGGIRRGAVEFGRERRSEGVGVAVRASGVRAAAAVGRCAA
jgi:hypothetical protein